MHIYPEDLVTQALGTEPAAARREVKLWLVISDEMPERRYAVDAEHAWAHCNDAYAHVSSAYETPGPNAACWYELRDAT